MRREEQNGNGRKSRKEERGKEIRGKDMNMRRKRTGGR
jgi:hypothetical protein